MWARESKNMDSGEARSLLHFCRRLGNRHPAFHLATPPYFAKFLKQLIMIESTRAPEASSVVAINS
jgi:hypothetical protein